MKIGIVGTGNMGKVIGLTLAQQGHSVFFGARDSSKVSSLVEDFDMDLQHGTNQGAADYGEVIYYNPRDVAPGEVLADIAALNGKPIICSHNSVVPPDFAFQPIALSKAEILQSQIPLAHVVTAFNTTTQETFELSGRGLKELNIACLVASDDVESKSIVSQLVEQIGFNAIDCGDLRQSRLIESAADLVRMLMYKERTPWKGLSFISLPKVPQLLGGRLESRLHNHNVNDT